VRRLTLLVESGCRTYDGLAEKKRWGYKVRRITLLIDSGCRAQYDGMAEKKRWGYEGFEVRLAECTIHWIYYLGLSQQTSTSQVLSRGLSTVPCLVVVSAGTIQQVQPDF
jgi:hypothetical protein